MIIFTTERVLCWLSRPEAGRRNNSSKQGVGTSLCEFSIDPSFCAMSVIIFFSFCKATARLGLGRLVFQVPKSHSIRRTHTQ
jgi:hypothetical protein